MVIVISIEPHKTFIKKWIHKLFGCPTYWKSKWNTLWKSKPFYKCRECEKPLHCYWDGNDTKKGTDFCNKCAANH